LTLSADNLRITLMSDTCEPWAGIKEHLPGRYVRDSICNACYSLMASRPLVEYMDRLARDGEFQKKVAYARVYYLHETEMARRLGLGQAATSVPAT